MAEQVFPTKGNLINAKKFLAISTLGYDLLDKKRNVLIREMMQKIEETKQIQNDINSTYIQAYKALENANITMGVISKIAESIPAEQSIDISYRSVMGVEIPKITIEKHPPDIVYGFYMTNSELDTAFIRFNRVKELTATLAEVENSIYRLAVAIKKTQKRANALKNILIPKFNAMVKFISDSLEEKEREEFSRLKVIKFRKLNADA